MLPSAWICLNPCITRFNRVRQLMNCRKCCRTRMRKWWPQQRYIKYNTFTTSGWRTLTRSWHTWTLQGHNLLDLSSTDHDELKALLLMSSLPPSWETFVRPYATHLLHSWSTLRLWAPSSVKMLRGRSSCKTRQAMPSSYKLHVINEQSQKKFLMSAD